jgi:hypothetical protein
VGAYRAPRPTSRDHLFWPNAGCDLSTHDIPHHVIGLSAKNLAMKLNFSLHSRACPTNGEADLIIIAIELDYSSALEPHPG